MKRAWWRHGGPLKSASEKVLHLLAGAHRRFVAVPKLMAQVRPHRTRVVEGMPDAVVDMELDLLVGLIDRAARRRRPVVSTADDHEHRRVEGYTVAPGIHRHTGLESRFVDPAM